eukprot:g10584.t1
MRIPLLEILRRAQDTKCVGVCACEWIRCTSVLFQVGAAVEVCAVAVGAHKTAQLDALLGVVPHARQQSLWIRREVSVVRRDGAVVPCFGYFQNHGVLVPEAGWTPPPAPLLPASLQQLGLPLMLGSQSAARQALLREVGLPFTVRVADLVPPRITPAYLPLCPDERSLTVPGFDGPREESDACALTTTVAQAKAAAILASLPADYPESLLLTSDSAAHFDGVIREKPSSEQELRQWWPQYQVKPVQACTSVVVTNTKTRQSFTDYARCQQLYKRMPSSVLDQLIAVGVLINCAGGYIVDEPLVWPYMGPRLGSQTCLTGFPMDVVYSLLEKATKR